MGSMGKIDLYQITTTAKAWDNACEVYPAKHVHSSIALVLLWLIYELLIDLWHLFTYIPQLYFTGTGTTIW